MKIPLLKEKKVRKHYTEQFFRGNLFLFSVSILYSILMGSINLALSWLMQQIVDMISGVPGSLELCTLAALTGGILCIIIVFRAIGYFSVPRFMEKAVRQYKDYFFRKMTQKSISSFNNAELTSRYISALTNDVTTIESSYLELLFDFFANSLICLGSIAMMLAYSPILTLVACSLFLLPICATVITGKQVVAAETYVSAQNENLTAVLHDSLNGFSIVKSFRAESSFINIFEKANAQTEGAKRKKREVQNITSTIGSVASVAAQFGTLLIGAYLMSLNYGITPGILIVFLDLTSNVIAPLRSMPELIAVRKAATALIDKHVKILSENIQDDRPHCLNELKNCIELKEVSFSYIEGKETLHKISATFEKGKSYAIVGESGSGKSTILSLLLGWYRNYTGKILFDGHPQSEISCESLFNLTSYIQQKVFIFNTSIRNNITMFNHYPEDLLERAIVLSGLQEVVDLHGIDYLCGENGSGLSGGERQRIAIARCILREAPILLVDEATSALDAQTAYDISSLILNLKCLTRIVVTHSLDERLLSQYDCILVVKNGQIVETGDFSDLIARDGYFCSLFSVSQ